MKLMSHALLLGCLTGWMGCTIEPENVTGFAGDLAFMREHLDTVLLTQGDSAVAVAPGLQGRVMTSTFDQHHGPSFGWINRPVIERGFLSDAERAGRLEDHIYVFGGEERFWLGPEGGQFSIYFKPGAPFEFSDWKVPAAIDTEAYEVTAQTEDSVSFSHEASLVNWSGRALHVGIERTVRLLDRGELAEWLGIEGVDEAISLVAYESSNTIRNLGDTAWTRESGMLSIWLLGMYPPSAGTIMAIPFKAGSVEELGPKVNDTYFGKVPSDYLRVDEDVLFMRGDGTRRGKIGISPARSKWVAGSYDVDAGILNLVATRPVATDVGYVNSMWEMQEDPFSGDVINAYNDGSPAPGQPPLGPFYELETSSPAAALAPGESMTHAQITVHLTGPQAAVDQVAREVLGVSLERIASAF